MAEPNYEIDYNDKRFGQVETEKTAALNDLEETYADMTSKSDQFYDKQIADSKNWADKQADLQNKQTDFAIQKIEQQIDQAQKDYTKEQSGAWVDYQKQSNRYGADAEQRASIGMAGTGWSESAQVAYHNQYQNRVAKARESYNQTIMNYNNNIAEAKLQNSSILAEIAYNAQKEQLELALAGFQYKNQLLLDKVEKKTTLEQNYYQRYRDVINQINTENALAEEVRQFDILHPANTGKKPGYLTDPGTCPATIDIKSVLDLGYGPISASTLNGLVRSGVAKEYEENGKIKFRKVEPKRPVIPSKFGRYF